jgi:hypothetical protein
MPSKDDVTKGSVTFYLKDLSDPKAPLQVETVGHDIVGGLAVASEIKALIGGRDQTGGHLWGGQLARLVVSEGALNERQLLVRVGGDAGGGESGVKRVVDWDFSGGSGREPEAKTAWRKPEGSNLAAWTGLET